MFYLHYHLFLFILVMILLLVHGIHLLYLNKKFLLLFLHSRLWLFADDFKIIGDFSTTEYQALNQTDVQAKAEWSASNKLPILTQRSPWSYITGEPICVLNTSSMDKS